MEENTENEEANLELQPKDVQEDRPEVRMETEQPTKETTKRKRGVEETETKQRQEEEVSKFVTNNALALWEKSLNEKDFIVERGFNKLISPTLH